MDRISNYKYDKEFKSKYKHVYRLINRKDGSYIFQGNKRRTKLTSASAKQFNTEREAALYVDKCLIEQKKDPVNILVRKK